MPMKCTQQQYGFQLIGLALWAGYRLSVHLMYIEMMLAPAC